MNPQFLPLTIGGTVLKESDDLDILGVTFDSKMTFVKHHLSVSRAASHMNGTLRKFSQVSYRRLLERLFRCLVSCPFCGTVLLCGALLPINTFNY